MRAAETLNATVAVGINFTSTHARGLLSRATLETSMSERIAFAEAIAARAALWRACSPGTTHETFPARVRIEQGPRVEAQGEAVASANASAGSAAWRRVSSARHRHPQRRLR